MSHSCLYPRTYTHLFLTKPRMHPTCTREAARLTYILHVLVEVEILLLITMLSFNSHLFSCIGLAKEAVITRCCVFSMGSRPSAADRSTAVAYATPSCHRSIKCTQNLAPTSAPVSAAGPTAVASCYFCSS